MVGVAAQPIVKYFENHPYNMIMGIPRLSKEATSLLLLRSTMSKKKKKKKKGNLLTCAMFMYTQGHQEMSNPKE